MLKLSRQIPPHDQKISAKNIRFADLDIPREISAYAPSPSNLTAFLLPDQEMVNWVQKEIAIAAAKDPPFAPHLTPKLCDAPWMPLDTDHKTARTRWMGVSNQARRRLIPQELSIRAFSFYRLRFVLSADIGSAWLFFGGIGPKLSHFATALHISITESVGSSFSYRRLGNLKLQEKGASVLSPQLNL